MIVAGYILLGLCFLILALSLFSNMSLGVVLIFVSVLIILFVIPGVTLLILGYIFRRKRASNIQYACPKCGKRVYKGYLCCVHCGTKIEIEEDEKFCAGCGKELNKRHNFCPHCGKKR